MRPTEGLFNAVPRIIDLSTPIVEGHFRWPVERRLTSSHTAGNVFEATRAALGVHAFTHMDAPRHYDPDGFTTDGVSLDSVIGEAAVIDISAVAEDAPVTEAMMEAAGGHVGPGDIVLVRTDWDRRADIGTPEFWTRAPYMTAGAAEGFRGRGVKAVGFDFPQDYCIRHFVTGEKQPAREDNTTHVVLLVNGIILFEYLCNMGEISGARTCFVGLPLKIPGCDGAPARAIAIDGLRFPRPAN